MQKLIIDTNILVRFPKILSLKQDKYQIIIPTDVIDEISGWSVRRGNNQFLNSSLHQLIEKAQNEGTIIITDIPDNQKERRKLMQFHRLSETDTNILLYGLLQKQNGSDVAIVSEDREILRAANSNGIKSFGLNELTKIFSNVEVAKNDKVLDEAENHSRKERKNIIFSFILGAVVTLVGVIIYFNIQRIAETINVWGTILLSILIGIGLFVFREKKRLAYGIAEFLAGIATVIILFSPDFDYNLITFDLSFGLKMFGALYIMVRGQDNIIKSLNGTKQGFWIKDKIGIG